MARSSSVSTTSINASTNDQRVASSDQSTAIGAGFSGNLVQGQGQLYNISQGATVSISQLFPDTIQRAFDTLGGVAQQAVSLAQTEAVGNSNPPPPSAPSQPSYLPLLMVAAAALILLR